MTTAASVASPPVLPSQATLPVRSPRTSIVLAEVARHRRFKRRRRQQRRRAWARRAAWIAACSRQPFQAIPAPTALGVVFVGTMPFVYFLRASWWVVGYT
jgi:hypothetical protein